MQYYFCRVFEGNVVEETTAGPTTGVEELTTEALVVTEPVTSNSGVNVSVVILSLDLMLNRFECLEGFTLCTYFHTSNKTRSSKKHCKTKISSI